MSTIAHRKNLGYNRPAPDKNGAGLGSLNDQRQWPQLAELRLFYALQHHFLVPRAGELKSSQVKAPLVACLPTPPRGATRLGSGGTDSPSDQSENAMQNAITVHIAVIDGQPTTTTQDIAQVYGKDHRKVLAVVRQRMEEAGEWGTANFSHTTYTNQQNGQTYPVIRMTKKGFHFVVGKFTGAKAVKHQIAFADAFEQMEAELQSQQRITTEAPYSVLPGQKLSAENAAELRIMVQKAAERLPKDKQGAFCVKAWSKLKSHFGVGYRDIPESQFSDAVSILGRHIIECVGTTAGPEGSWLLQLDSDGRKTMTQLGWDDCIVKWDDLPKLIAATDNMLAPQLVADIAAAAASRMAQTLRLH